MMSVCCWASAGAAEKTQAGDETNQAGQKADVHDGDTAWTRKSFGRAQMARGRLHL
jgi:hypothetical protein